MLAAPPRIFSGGVVARDPHLPGAPLGAGDLQLLVWVSEQYAVRVDQIAVLRGCGERAAQYTVARLRTAGLVELWRPLTRQASWVLLTAAGQRLAGTGHRRWVPGLGLLAHVAAVCDVRLQVQRRSPGSVWVCERQLAREREHSGEHVADGVVVSAGREDVMEVELTVKSAGRIEEIIDGLSVRYTSVVYFAAPQVRRRLEQLGGSERWPLLQIRDLPEGPG